MRQETASQRGARWMDKETLYPKYPLYEVVAADPSSGSSTQIVVKGKVVKKWLDRIDLILTYHRFDDPDGVALGLEALMISLTGIFLIPLAQASPWRSGTPSTHPVSDLFGNLALVLWVYAIDPIGEHRGVRQELNDMREAVQAICSSEAAKVLLLFARGRIENSYGETTDNARPTDRYECKRTSHHAPATGAKAGTESTVSTTSFSTDPDPLPIPISDFPSADLYDESVLTDVSQEITSTTSLEGSGSSVTQGATAIAWGKSAYWAWTAKQKTWNALESITKESSLCEVIPGWAISPGAQSELRIKGQPFRYWTSSIYARYDGQDPARLVPQLAALLNAAKDPPKSYRLDQLEGDKVPPLGTLHYRRTRFRREVALAVWITAVDNETSYWTMVSYLEWLRKKAYCQVGLLLPENRPVVTSVAL